MKTLALAVVAGGVASFLVLLAGVAMVSVPAALILFGAAGLAAAGFLLIYDPERSAR